MINWILIRLNYNSNGFQSLNQKPLMAKLLMLKLHYYKISVKYCYRFLFTILFQQCILKFRISSFSTFI